ncbi:MAG: MBOAT family O-acyltransferase [Bdellovibrionota bacterium]
MTFTSSVFFIFFWIFFVLYFALGKKKFWQNLLTVAASYLFYGWWDLRCLGLIIASTLIDFILARCVEKHPHRGKAWVTISVVVNLTFLGFFKYYNFFVDSFAELATSLGLEAANLHLNIVLPIGISFYTFHSLSYIVDLYRKEMKASREFLDFAAYVAFFPQLVAGPIGRGTQLIPQFQTPRTFDYDRARSGAREALWGILKKVVFADNFAIVVNFLYADALSRNGATLLFAHICFAFQIYCDFSAYSNIARGISRILGIELMVNFNKPYIAQSVSDFWKRWHISLTTWFRDYVYISIGGNRKGTYRTQFNIMAVFLLSGIWHGANWTFLAWGALHGCYFAFEKFIGSFAWIRRWNPPGITVVRIVVTFSAVVLAWIYFRATSIEQANAIVAKVLTDFRIDDFIYVIESYPGVSFAIPLIYGLELLPIHERHDFDIANWPLLARWSSYVVIAICILAYSAREESTFIYFQF